MAMNARQKAAFSYLGADLGADALEAPQAELDDARKQSGQKTKETANLVGTGIGALIGAYFGNPQLGAAIGGMGGDVVGGLAGGGGTSDSGSTSESEAIGKMAGMFGGAGAAPTAATNPNLNSNLPPAAGPSGGPASMDALSPEEYRRRMNIGQDNKVDIASLIRAAYQGSMNA
jgi:hypothetical protein